MPAKKSVNLEKALAELEQLVEEMEQGNLSLEESLKRFEKGIALTSDCQQALHKAELKVQELIGILGNTLEENLTGVRIVKAFSRQKEESRRFSNQAQDLYEMRMNAERQWAQSFESQTQ